MTDNQKRVQLCLWATKLTSEASRADADPAQLSWRALVELSDIRREWQRMANAERLVVERSAR